MRKMNTGFRRAALGIATALLLLGAVPTAVLAGGQPSCGDTLTANTTLTANLDCSGYNGTALFMGKDGISLNLNGKTITGPTGNEGYYGVSTDGYHRTTVRNGKINHYYIGVYVSGSNRTLVQNIQMIGENLGDYGVYVYTGTRNTLNLLNISSVETAVYAEYDSRLTVSNSTLSGGLGGGEGVYLYYSTADTVSNNHVTGYYGTYEYRSHRNVYSGNTATGGTHGFYFDCDGYGQVTVSGNRSSNTDNAGFSLNYCYTIGHPVDGYIGTRVVGNTSTGGSYGFESYDSFNELWRNNVGNDNEHDGFWFESPSGYQIVYNTALRNDSNGFTLYENGTDSNVDRFSFNTARRNDVHGFEADYGAPGDDNVATNNGAKNCVRVDCS